MTSDDQVAAVEILTRVASVTMGLREQMDVIRIINPEATVLPTDTEFEIGMNQYHYCLSGSRWYNYGKLSILTLIAIF